jgi:hypothetical protein
MAYYVIPGHMTCSAAYNGNAAIAFASTTINGSARRGKAYEVIFGATSNPNSTDCVIQYDVSRMTASGSLAGTSYTPNVLDPADGACSAIGYILVTTAPTVTATSSLLNVGLNQRNSQRWQAAQESQMMVWPATTGNGLVTRCLSPTYAADVGIQLSFME